MKKYTFGSYKTVSCSFFPVRDKGHRRVSMLNIRVTDSDIIDDGGRVPEELNEGEKKTLATEIMRFVRRIKEEAAASKPESAASPIETLTSSAVQGKDYSENSLEFAKFLEAMLNDSAEEVIDYDIAVASFVMQGKRLKLDGGWTDSINANPASRITVSIQEGTTLMTVRKKSVSSPVTTGGIDASLRPSSSSGLRSASIPDQGMGGIDFRALPMTIRPMGSFSGLNFNLPQLSRAELERININLEMQQISNMVQAGILPSGGRIKEFIAACVQKGEITARADDLLLCFIDICNLQEENAYESSPEFREALVIVDSQA